MRQGHYAHDDKAISGYRSADYTIERIADLVKLDFGALTLNPLTPCEVLADLDSIGS